MHDVDVCGMFYSIFMFCDMHVICVCGLARIMTSFESKMVILNEWNLGFII